MPCVDLALQILYDEPLRADHHHEHEYAICSLTVRAGVPSSTAQLSWSVEDHARVAGLIRAALDALDDSIDDAHVAERAAAAEPVIARALGEPTEAGAA